MAECIVEIDYRGQLIRCEDCKYYDRQNDEVWEWGLCSRYKVAGINIAVNYDEYCSKAERREETE